MSYNVGDLIPIRDTLLDEKLDSDVMPGVRYLETSGTNNYTINTDGTFDGDNGDIIRANFVSANTGNSTVSVDGSAAIPIVISVSPIVNVPADGLSGRVILVYDSLESVFYPYPAFSWDDKYKLSNSENYVHPSSHPVSMIDGALSESEIDAKIASVVDSAPGTLDTLNEIALALGNDPNLATTLTNLIAEKAMFKAISATFLASTTQLTVNDAFIKENNCKVDVQPEGDKDGDWSASYVDGSVTITSDTTESIDVPITVYVTKTSI